MKNHVENIYSVFLKEPELLKVYRIIAYVVTSVSAILFISGTHKFNFWLLLIGFGLAIFSSWFGEKIYKVQMVKAKTLNKQLIIQYLNQNSLATIEKVSLLSNQLLLKSQESKKDLNTLLTILAALFAPIYIRVINVLIVDVDVPDSAELIIQAIFSITIFITFLLLPSILFIRKALENVFWFLNTKERTYKKLSAFLIEEVLLEI